MKKSAGITALILSTITLFSGCSLGLNDPALLSPPKITGREAELENLISQTADGSYKLKYPLSGEFRSAIITEDLDSDNKDEAIAFYRTDENITNMLVMYDTGGEWKISKNFEIKFTDVDCVRFADYDFDGVEEIFTGFTNSNDSACELNIYNYTPKGHKCEKTAFKTEYSSFTTGDYDQDGGSEILTLTLDSSENDASAVLFDYNKNKLYALDSCDMDTGVTKFENISSGLINKDTMGVVVDGLLENGYNSQIIYYNNSKRSLLNYPVSTDKKGNSTVRSDKIYSADIDRDGYIEIPVVDSSVSKAKSESETVAPVINWSSLNTKNNKLSVKVKCVSNFEFGYYFKLPESFSETTVTTLSENNRTMKIYSKKSNNADELIASFKIFDVGTASDEMSGYSTLESYNQYIYTYKIESNSPISISGETLKENFALNE